MLSGFAKLALVGTSLAPVLITLAWVRYVDGHAWPEGASYLLAAGATVLLCVLLIKAARTQLEVVPFSARSVRTADAEIVGFVLAYLLPLVEAGGVAIRGEIFWFVVAILAAIIWSTNAYHVNPLLGMLGYHFYEVTTDAEVTFVLITRRSLRQSGRVTRAVQLTEYMVLDVGS
jgi:hypothetical protein